MTGIARLPSVLSPPTHFASLIHSRGTRGEPMPEMTHGHHATGAQDRLASLRSPRQAHDPTHRSQRSTRIEILVGLIVVIIGISIALNVLTTRREVTQQVRDQAPVEVSSGEPSGNRLLDGEGLIALAVENGDFPPGLRSGDMVRLVLTPGADGQGGVREVDETLMVMAVDETDEPTGMRVVTVRGPIDTAIAVASSGPVHLTIVERAGT